MIKPRNWTGDLLPRPWWSYGAPFPFWSRCQWCGEKYVAKTRTARWCPDCRGAAKREADRWRISMKREIRREAADEYEQQLERRKVRHNAEYGARVAWLSRTLDRDDIEAGAYGTRGELMADGWVTVDPEDIAYDLQDAVARSQAGAVDVPRRRWWAATYGR